MPFRLTKIFLLSLAIISEFVGPLSYADEKRGSLFVQQETVGDIVTLTLYANPEEKLVNAVEVHISFPPSSLSFTCEELALKNLYKLPQDIASSSVTLRYVSPDSFQAISKIAVITFKKETNGDTPFIVESDSLLLLSDGKGTNIFKTE